MTYDDVATRAGEALRARFDDAVPPSLAEPANTGGASRPHRRASALVAVAAVLVVALVVALVASRSSSEPASSRRTWQRIDMTKAFGNGSQAGLDRRDSGRLRGGGDGHSSSPAARQAQHPRDLDVARW